MTINDLYHEWVENRLQPFNKAKCSITGCNYVGEYSDQEIAGAPQVVICKDHYHELHELLENNATYVGEEF